MNRFEKLELNVETLRELTEQELAQVAGGVSGATCIVLSQTCPTQGPGWTMRCDPPV
jgi:bacteriocin-like protein